MYASIAIQNASGVLMKYRDQREDRQQQRYNDCRLIRCMNSDFHCPSPQSYPLSIALYKRRRQLSSCDLLPGIWSNTPRPLTGATPVPFSLALAFGCRSPRLGIAASVPLQPVCRRGLRAEASEQH